MSEEMNELRRRAERRWRKNRRKLIAQGRWEPFVEAQPVRERVWAMNRAGMPATALVERLGLLPTALDHLLWKRDGEFSREVRTETADAVMGYWPTLQDFPPRSLIDSTGTHRRIHALMTLGWTQRAIANRMGIQSRSLSRALLKPRVTADMARHIAAVYDVVWKRGPSPDEVEPEVAHRIRQFAAHRSFPGPLAWDDDTIDDPKAQPLTDAVEPVATEGENVADRWLHGEAVILRPEDRRQVVQHLFEWTNDTPEEIAARLEMTVDAVWQAWSRIKKKARQEGRTKPWRRVYVPRERDLNQNQMEEAA